MFDVWPVCTLKPLHIASWFSGGAAKVGGRTASGALRVAQWSAGGLVRITYADINVLTRTQILAAQALEGILDGGATPIIVPMLPWLRAPDVDGGTGGYGGVPHSDGTPFSDGSLYASSGEEALTYASALMNATTIQIVRPGAAQALIGGEMFSVENDDGPEGHKIIRILDMATVGPDVVYTVVIRVPLRADIAAGSAVAMKDPRCLVRMENAAELGVLLRNRRYGKFTAQFVEAVPE